MVVEAGELRSPALEAKEAIVDRGCRELGIRDSSSFHAQENSTAWGQWGHQHQRKTVTREKKQGVICLLSGNKLESSTRT